MVSELPAAMRLNLAIGLPLRNQAKLAALLAEIADPASANFHHYLTAAEFAAEFGPTQQDYEQVTHFAQESGFTVAATHPNRMLLDVTASVADAELALHVRLMAYDHPVRGRFYAPDREPSVEAGAAILDISGLDNFESPHPMSLHSLPVSQAHAYVTGSGPSGYYAGQDFRAAYAPGVSLTGSGQVVGLAEFDGFYPGDVQKNAAAAGVAVVPTQTVLLNGFTGLPGSSNIEVVLDIMMASYMAPGLAKVMVYEGLVPNDVLNRMATDDVAQQLSCSWGFGTVTATTEQIYQEYAAQGQSMLQASGDGGAYTGGVPAPADNPNLTIAGGTSLVTAGAGGPWQAETAWPGSGGGASTVYALPSYQQALSMSANHGSVTMRNIPDVAMVADLQIFLIQNNGQAVVAGGTSAAAPLWAGFIALANQQAAANGKPPLGFLNPLLYSLGGHGAYTADFHDIKTGDNGGYAAVTGYDLATGWGTPAGQSLIDDLAGVAGDAGFVLTNASPLLTLQPGGAGTALLTVTGSHGFAGNVTMALSGLPAGLTAVFSPPVTAGVSQLTVSATAAAQSGTYPVTITGTAGSLSSSAGMLVNVVAPSFKLSVSPGMLGLLRGENVAATVTIKRQNGFSGAVAMSAAGLPHGVTAAFAPPWSPVLSSAGISAATSAVTFVAAATTPAGSYPITLTGTAPGLQSSASFTLRVLLPTAGTTPVNLAPAYDVEALVTDGFPFSGGGLAYSATLLGVEQRVGGVLFVLGPADALNAVSARTVALPAGRFSVLHLLATGWNGNQPAQVFKVVYTDGSSVVYRQGVSDWSRPRNFARETTALSLPYRDTSLGTKEEETAYLFEYSFPLNAAKAVARLVLPGNRNVVVLAATLVTGGIMRASGGTGIR